MTQSRNYADSHRVTSISAKRFEASPYVDRYATPQTIFGVYSGRFYPLSLGQDPVADYGTGAAHGLEVQSLESLGIRRIEAGILDNGTDIDSTMTPFGAGLGAFVELDKPDFIGKGALVAADPRPRLFGISGPATPIANDRLFLGEDDVGRVTTGAWSPFLECGIGYVCTHAPGSWVGAELRREDGVVFTVVELPFHDRDKAIPRGLAT